MAMEATVRAGVIRKGDTVEHQGKPWHVMDQYLDGDGKTVLVLGSPSVEVRLPVEAHVVRIRPSWQDASEHQG